MKSIIVLSLLSMSAINAYAYEATGTSVKTSVMNPQLVISTSDALTKLAELRIKYECVKAQAKANNAEICKGLAEYSEFLEKVKLEAIASADEDLSYAISSGGESVTAKVDAIVSSGRDASSEFKELDDVDQYIFLQTLPKKIVELK